MTSEGEAMADECAESDAIKCVRGLAFALFLVGACFAGANAYLNESRCVEFKVFAGVGAAASLFVPVVLFGIASCYLSRAWPIVILTGVFGVAFCGLGIESFVSDARLDDALLEHRRCDVRGDDTSLGIFIFTVVGAFAWGLIVASIGIIYVLLPSSIRQCIRTRNSKQKRH